MLMCNNANMSPLPFLIQGVFSNYHLGRNRLDYIRNNNQQQFENGQFWKEYIL
jgi:hypothetical protein